MKPILFSTEMVRAILEWRKTATRRVIKPQPKARLSYRCMGYRHGKWSYPAPDVYKYWGDEWKRPVEITAEDEKMLWAAPCNTDDILYVRETWADAGGGHILYRADADKLGSAAYYLNSRAGSTYDGGVRWRPSIHMPKEAARIFLRVTGVRVERLQDITEDEAFAEGAQTAATFQSTRSVFFDIWDSTIKPADCPHYGWEANPWVWVIEFERINREEALVASKEGGKDHA